jgi:hypothetical protein
MSSPNGGFNWQSWADTQDDAVRSQRRAEAEEECLGVQHLNEFMEQAREIKRESDLVDEWFNKEK